MRGCSTPSARAAFFGRNAASAALRFLPGAMFTQTLFLPGVNSPFAPSTLPRIERKSENSRKLSLQPRASAREMYVVTAIA